MCIRDSKYFNESHGPQEHLLANNLSPKDKNFKTNISEYPGYSYHINAFQFGESLRKHTAKDKFTEIVGTVNKIHTDKQNISAIELSTGQKIEADIFFDDQAVHCENASSHVASGHVPSGVANE